MGGCTSDGNRAIANAKFGRNIVRVELFAQRNRGVVLVVEEAP
jgi:hypothetical protein